jgi:putative ABC transport system permease protein
MLAESLLLALAAGAIGLVAARGGVVLLSTLAERSIPRLSEVRLDVRLFLFALALSVVTGVAFGIVPAMQATSGDLNRILVATTRGGTMGRSGRTARSALVIAEVTLAVVVLIAAGLLMRSFIRLRAADPGFQPDGLLTFRLPLAGGRNAAPERRVVFVRQLSEALARIPGVQSVGAVNTLPLTGLGVGGSFAAGGRPAPPVEQRQIGLMRSVTPAYFRSMGLRLVSGREFTDADAAQSPAVVIVGETLARRFWPGGGAVGERLVLDLPNVKGAEIVGVVKDVKPERLEGEDWPTIYSTYPQAPAVTMTMVVRTAGPPAAVAAAVRRAVHRLDPGQPLADLRTMDVVVEEAVAGSRFNAVVLAIFAVLAFTLAAVGIYGVIAYDVSERTHELGIRLALGAQRSDVLRMVVGQGTRLAAAGIGIGLIVSFGLTRLMGSMLYDVRPTDASTFLAIALGLGAVAIAASWLPSRRAVRLDPAVALRHE